MVTFLARHAADAVAHDLLRGGLGTIFAFQTFGQIDLLTQGGPLKKTNVLTYFIYRQLNCDPGKAAVLAVALFFITLAARTGADPAPRTAGVL